MKLDRGLLIITSLTCGRKPRLYGNVSRFPDVNLPTRLFMTETTLGEDQGGAHATHGRGTLIDPAGSGLAWMCDGASEGQVEVKTVKE